GIYPNTVLAVRDCAGCAQDAAHTTILAVNTAGFFKNPRSFCDVLCPKTSGQVRTFRRIEPAVVPMNAHPNAGIFGEFSGVSLVAFTSISGKFGRRFHGD